MCRSRRLLIAAGAVLLLFIASVVYAHLWPCVSLERRLEDEGLVTAGLKREPERVELVVSKTRGQLDFRVDGRPIKEYPVAIGSGIPTKRGTAARFWGFIRYRRGAKEAEGDRRTPEGEYRLTEDLRNSLGVQRHFPLLGSAQVDHYRFAALDYPNEADRLAGRTGSAVGIHGTGAHLRWLGRLHARFHWTNGCIALRDQEIDEIEPFIGRGTRVTIEP